MPLISVCIPAYNRVGVLPALVDSILNQDFDDFDFDIVMAEDCSPERPAIAATAAEYQQRVGEKVKYHENSQTLGYDGNLRRLIEVATGDYVLFMGNDDLLAPGALAAVAAAVRERQDVGVVLRSYSSFVTDPAEVVQVFRYFDGDRVFPPGPDTVVTFFRRCVFISGMVFKRSAAAALATTRFDGTLLYQQHLAGHILAKESGVYLNRILSYHRLGGVPDFGASAAEKELFVPKQQTPASSVHFMRGMLEIAYSLDAGRGAKVGRRILRDIGNYAYPILSIQADRSLGTFLSYLWQLMKLGFWRVPLFHGYALGLLVLGRKNCDGLIARIKKSIGRAPILGGVYAGQSRETKGDRMTQKVVVRLKGGLGNQLFCYAAARRLAWANDAELVLDAVTGFKYDHLYRRTYALGCFSIPARLATPAEQMEPLGRVRRLIARKLSDRKPLEQRRYIQQVGVDFDPGIMALRLQDGTTYFDAFGQSERYFADIRQRLQQDLVMSAPEDRANLAMAAQIESTESVALHVRWFDASDGAHSSNMSLTYYAAAIPQLLAKIPGAHFFVFSDRPSDAATLLSPLMAGRPFTLVSHNAETGNAEADFWLMRQCRHFIIGNSTFAWWAAWLGEQERQGTQVFAPARNADPENSVTAWGFPELLPERWTVL